MTGQWAGRVRLALATTLLVAALAAGAAACSDDEGTRNGDTATGDASDLAGDRAIDVPGLDLAEDAPASDTGDGGSDAPADSGDVAPDALSDADDAADETAADTADAGDAPSEAGADTDDDATGDTGDQDSGQLAICGGFAGWTCPDDEYCNFPDDICGGADGTGLCLPRPEVCNALYAPVCGCDGEVHSNACRASQVGTDVSALGGCEPPEGMTPCGSRFCFLELAYCLRVIPGVPEAPTSYSCQLLPTCDDPTSCDCLADEECVTSCEEREDGSLLATCVAP